MDFRTDTDRVHAMTGLRMDQIQARNHIRGAQLARAEHDRRHRLAVANAVEMYSRRASAARADTVVDLPATVPVPLDANAAHIGLSQAIGAPVAPTIAGRLEPMPQPWGLADVARAIAAVLLILGTVVVLTACGGGDASPDEAAEHDAQMTTQPVACAASGCAR